MKKSFFIVALLFIILILSGCSNAPEEFKLDNPGTYQKINSENAKMLQDEGRAYIIDVRTQGEYDSGHVPSAYLSNER
jgi:PBP1b-binding outer membrane lipoprotein LpoB